MRHRPAVSNIAWLQRAFDLKEGKVGKEDSGSVLCSWDFKEEKEEIRRVL